jgi:hypothetical protein
MESRFPFMFSSVVTAEELDESFIDTSHLSIDGFAVIWSEADLQVPPEEAVKLLGFDKLEDGSKYISFLSRPLVPLDADSNFLYQVFPSDIDEYLRSGLRHYVAMLSRLINSAPGGDSNWPYGRYFLREIDGNFGAKLINIGLRLPFQDTDDHNQEKWGVPELHQLYDNLRLFGLNLCNFKDPLSEEIGPWPGFFEIVTYLENSEHPLVDKVAVKNIVLEIVNKYLNLRKLSSRRHAGMISDLMVFKRHFRSYEEIQSIDTYES